MEYTKQDDINVQPHNYSTNARVDSTLDQYLAESIEIISSTKKNSNIHSTRKKSYFENDATLDMPTMQRTKYMTSQTFDLLLIRHSELFENKYVEDKVTEWDKYWKYLTKDAKWKLSEDTVEDAIKSIIYSLQKKYPNIPIRYERIYQRIDKIPDFIIYLGKVVIPIEVKNRREDAYWTPEYIENQVLSRFRDKEWELSIKGYKVLKVLISPDATISDKAKKLLEKNHITHIKWGRQIMTYHAEILRTIANKLDSFLAPIIKKLRDNYNNLKHESVSIIGVYSILQYLHYTLLNLVTNTITITFARFKHIIHDWLRRLRKLNSSKNADFLECIESKLSMMLGSRYLSSINMSIIPVNYLT